MSTFDESAKDWDSDPDKVTRARVVADEIRKVIPLSQKMNAFEYGCGTGLLSFALQTDLGQITLADTSQGMLDVLGEKISNAGVTNMHPLHLDLMSDPLPNEKYQLTYSLLVLHHIPDARGVLKKFHDILDPKGYLFVADLEKEDGTFHTHGTHDVHKGFESSDLQQWTEEAGFDHVRFSTVYEIKRDVEGKEKKFPVFLMMAQRS